MSNAKQGLKAAKAALDSQNFDEAASQARTVLEVDPKNYFAYVLSHYLARLLTNDRSNVFLGRALEKQGQIHPAIDAYKAATQIKPEEDLAWRGLNKAYEALGTSGIEGRTSSALGLAQIYAEKYVHVT